MEDRMTTQGSAPVEQTPEPVATGGDAKKDLVSYETHQKLLDEKKKVQAQAMEAQARLDELLAKEKEREEANARKRGDFEALVKVRDEELAKEKSRRLQLEETFSRGKKLNAIVDALGGSVDAKWLRLIDVDSVTVNPDTDEVDPLTVAKVAESLKREWPEMFTKAPKLPANAPQGMQGGVGKITRSEWVKLPSKEMAKWKHDQIID